MTVDSLADRDMFMRFRGGGIGHRYPQEFEAQLSGAGWGTSWPSMKDRDPEPDPEVTEPTQKPAHVQGGQDDSGNWIDLEDDSDGSEGDDGNLKELVDGDGEDKERPMPDGEEGDASMDEDDIHVDPNI